MKKKLAICITIYEKGGQSVLIEEIHKRMLNEYDVTIVCEKCTREVYPEFKVIEHKAWLNRYLPILDKNIVALLNDFDVIHCYDSISYMHAASKATRPFIVTTVGNSPFWVRGTLKGVIDAMLSNLIYSWGYPKADLVVAFSKYLKEWMKSRYNMNSVQIDLGVDRSKFKPLNLDQFEAFKKGKPQFLYIGQISQKKGCDELITEMSKLKEKYPNFLLQIIGFGEDYYLKKIDELINNHNLRKNIEIVGYVDNKDLVSYINACDVFVTPSRWEGFGMPILEAMACGKPCVALGKYNTKYLILDSNAGCIFNKKTQIAQAIECCLNNLEEYSQNALKFASRKEFDWTYHTEKLLEIYEGFLKK